MKKELMYWMVIATLSMAVIIWFGVVLFGCNSSLYNAIKTTDMIVKGTCESINETCKAPYFSVEERDACRALKVFCKASYLGKDTAIEFNELYKDLKELQEK